MNTFEIKGVSYRSQPLGAKAEFACCRRLTGVLRTLDVETLKSGDFMQLGLQMASFIGEMKEEDVDFVLNTVLPKVQRQKDGVWSAIASPGGELMDQSLQMGALVMILVRVLEGPVRDFLPYVMPQPDSPPPGSSEPPTTV